MGLIKPLTTITTDSFSMRFYPNDNLFDEVGANLSIVTPPGGGRDSFQIDAKSSKVVTLWLSEENYATLGRVASGGIDSKISFGKILEATYDTDSSSCIFILHPDELFRMSLTKGDLRMGGRLTLINPFDTIAYITHVEIVTLIPRR